MSKLIITPSSIEEILLYKDADCYLLGNEAFSVRYNHCFNATELRKAKEIMLPKYAFVSECQIL